MKPNPLLSALALACLHASSAGAQTGSLVGRVLDASSSLPVTGAVVTIEPLPGGLMIDKSQLARGRTIVTGESGAYRFDDVAPGRYRLLIDRLGYRAAVVEVSMQPVAAHVSVALEMEPIALQPVQVQQRAAALFQRARYGAMEIDEARVASEQVRQRLFLPTDSRMLTYADVMDGVTLGEGDVFRALQRFSGVSTRDDYSAELWTRGAPWTQTRVTFDGVPLFNPVHAVGILSAITPEVLGTVYFHPGVRPAGIADGAAGVIDMRSRAGSGQGELRGVVDVSLATAKLVLDQHYEGRGSWVVAARRSHLGLLTNDLLDSLDLPYVFEDVAARADLQLSERARVEASGLWEEDRLEGDVEGILERTTARWGNTAGRATLRVKLGKLELSNTVATSQFMVRTDARLVRTRRASTDWSEPASRNDIAYRNVTGELTASSWSVGYDVAFHDLDYDGPLPRYYAVKPDTMAKLRYQRDVRVAAGWADVRFTLGRFAFNPGVRIEDRNLAPRLALRWNPSQQQSVSLSLGRSWQYLQAIALAGPSVHPAFHAAHFWIDQSIRADIVSIGTERWLSRGWLASLNGYARRAVDVAVPDPTPGKLGRRPLYVLGENSARGVEAGLRRLGARWSAAFGYTLADSKIDVGRVRFPAPADRRHTLDAMLGVSISSSVRVAGAFTAMSGAPFTRAYAVTRADCTDFGFGCDNPDGSYVQLPNAERTPAYQSLDASVQWTHAFGRAQAVAYFQLRNVLDRDNASTYAGSRPLSRQTFEDRFEQGLRRLPLVGLRVSF